MKIPESLPPPSQPSEGASSAQTAAAAATSAFLSQLSEIASYMQASGAATAAAPVSATPAVSAPNPVNVTLEALQDLAAIDMALRHGNPTLALQYANDLMTNCNGNALSAMNTVISQMSADFTISGGKVTGINQSSFQTDWTKAGGGINEIFQNVMPQIPSSTSISSSNPMGFCGLFLFLADANLCPTVNDQTYQGQSYDNFVWNSQYGTGNFQQLFPMALTAAFYQQDINGTGTSGYSQFQSDLAQFISLLPTQSDINNAYPSNPPSATNYLQCLSNMNNLLTVYPANGDVSQMTFPPASIFGSLGSEYLLYFGITNGQQVPFGTTVDMSNFFDNVESPDLQFFLGSPF